MNYHNFREYQLLDKPVPIADHLHEDIICEYFIIWWGVAGLHAAHELIKQWVNGEEIVLVEKGICGSGMSGKSGWFLTPDSELGLRAIVNRYGETIAKKIRNFWEWWQASIVHNVKSYTLHCNLRKQDSLLLWIGSNWKTECKSEHEDRKEFGFDSELIASHKNLQQYITGELYNSGVKYKDCYGICWYEYCQQLKDYLIWQWVQIFEFTEVIKLQKNEAITNRGQVNFKYCFICPWKVSKRLSSEKSRLLYGVMNFITVSEPLTDEQLKWIMPWWDYMCRDTKLVFSYYRIIWWNRLILGWWNPISSFLPRDIQYEAAIKDTVHEFKKVFPSLKWVPFNEYRSGRIQVSKDLMPIIDTCNNNSNHTRVLWCAGLPWTAACGEFAVRRHFWLHDADLEKVFCEKRKRLTSWFPRNSIVKSFIFAISNAWAMFRQKGY